MAYRSTRTLSDMSGEKFIDSRDIVSRFEELESEREDLAQEVEDATEALSDLKGKLGKDDGPSRAEWEETDASVLTAERDLQRWDEENSEEFEALRAINDEGESMFSDWKHGATLIREDYFPEYAEELCKDIGDLPQDIPSYLVIDWDATADNLKVDYSTITIDGTEYLSR